MKERVESMIEETDGEDVSVKEGALLDLLELIESEEYYTYVTDKKGKSRKPSKEDLLDNINQDVIKQGHIFKNYKVLCDELGIKQFRNTKKQRQLDELEAYYFDIEKEGHKLIIAKVHNLNEFQRRARTLRQDYRDYIEEVIISLMIDELRSEERRVEQREGKSVYSKKLIMSPNQLANAISMVNKNYQTAIYNSGAFCVETNTNKEFFDDWKQSMNSFIRNSITSALDNLEDKCLIFSSKCLMVGVYEFDGIKEQQNVYGDTYQGTNNPVVRTDIRPATDDEIGYILSAQSEALTQLGLSKISEIYYRLGVHGTKRFNAKVVELLKDKYKCNIAFFFSSFELLFTEDVVNKYTDAESIDFGLTVKAKKQYQRQMSQMVKEKIDENAKNRNTRANKKLQESDCPSIKTLLRASEDYVQQSEDTSYLLVSSICNKDINKAVQKRARKGTMKSVMNELGNQHF